MTTSETLKKVKASNERLAEQLKEGGNNEYRSSKVCRLSY